ncbi:helix-turn-helix domain-containing protein [Ferrovibrio sp.]|uniref:winged helix-turn-helix transcriptional regulator n=1 Tax=Ferrovibrio sp. TaxID=1917215 RepID=UPI001B433114|nr:helix-turn-helix domain-containing protein [Ferrovibrio sp.]MBP7065092.1 helix-turn-helix transcriptional regulator [Ferrovibrio sp.]
MLAPNPDKPALPPIACADCDDPRVEELVRDLLTRLADRWTLLTIEHLATGPMRFSRLRERLPGVSQKMLTQTLRQLERDGVLTRHVHPVVPPHVEYRLTPLGESLGEAICGLWQWVMAHGDAMEAARQAFDQRLRETV